MVSKVNIQKRKRSRPRSGTFEFVCLPRVSIVQNLTARTQITPVLYGGVPGYLFNPIMVVVWGDAGDGDSRTLQMKEK